MTLNVVKVFDSAALQTQNSAQILNPVPQLHTPNGTLPITLPLPLLHAFTLITAYLYQKDERVLQCSKFSAPTVYSKRYSTSHCSPPYYYHHNHHHHHHHNDQTSLRLTFRLAVSKSLSV